MNHNTDNENEVEIVNDIAQKTETIVESATMSLDRKIDKISNTIEDKISNFDEKEFEENLLQFKIKVGSFFIIIIKCIIAFLKAIISIIRKIHNSKDGDVIIGLFILIIIVIFAVSMSALYK